MNIHVVSPLALERMVRAVEKVRDRLRRATQALEKGGIAYAVIGGHAVAVWVAEVDEAAVRNTQDVDILIRRSDFEKVKEALAAAGFVYRNTTDGDVFLDGPAAKPRDSIHIIFAGEMTRPEHRHAAPDVEEASSVGTFKALKLDALVRMKLTSFRLTDRVHLRDLIDVGLLDASWLERLPSDLAKRLQELLDNPEG